MTLAEFLLARYAEDEYWIFNAGNEALGLDRPDSADRLLGDIASKRAIVQSDFTNGAWGDDWDDGRNSGANATQETIIKVLALSFAWHPDYREEWKP